MSYIFDKNPEMVKKENINNIEETIESAILTKVKHFYNLHKILKYCQLNDFLDSINLSDVFGTDEDKEIIWTIFTKLSGGVNEIDYETCKKGIVDVFAFYVGQDSSENKADEGCLLENSPERVSFLSRISDSRNKNESLRESVQSKEKNLEELLTRMTLMKTIDKVTHHNNPSLIELEFGNSKQNNKKSVSTLNEHYRNNSKFGSPNKKVYHQRNVTKLFTEIDIEKLQQLRKVFSLLDLRNKDNVYISEVQEVINKYKFIKLTEDELINFLSFISDDLIERSKYSNGNNILKLSINFELYSRAMSVIEKQLLQVNTDTFSERNDSYDIHENYSEMIEDLHKTEVESIDYVMLLADFLKSIDYRVNYSITGNYDKILNKDFANENEEKIREQITDGVIYFKNKIKDMEMFLKEMNITSTKKQNKLTYLKMLVVKLEENLKNAEEDYRSLFQKFNMNQPVEINDEAEKLLEENIYLSEQKKIKDDQIDSLQSTIDEKDEQIFNLESRTNDLIAGQKELESSYIMLKNDYDSIKRNYDVLLNDIYDNILKQDQLQFMKKEEKLKSNKNIPKSNGEEQLIKLRDKLILSEENKKMFDMNYEQLIAYTLTVESRNKQLEEKNLLNEKRIKELEKEINSLKKSFTDNSKSIHMLKSENMRLHNKINELNKDVEMNHMFRPSKVLGSRVSRISKVNENRRSISGRFKNMEKLFEVSNSNNSVQDTQDIQTEIRISEMTVDEGIQFNTGPRKQYKLSQLDGSQIFANDNRTQNNKSNFELNRSNFEAIPKINHTNLEPLPLKITNEVLSRSNSISEKLLFDEKENDIFEPSVNVDNFCDNENKEIDKQVINKIIPIENFSNNNKKENLRNHLDEGDKNIDSIFTVKEDNFDFNPKKTNLETEKFKQVGVDKERNQLTNIINPTIGNKKYTKLPSLITEETLEEDEARNSINLKQSTKDLEVDMDELKTPHKHKDTFEDLGAVFNKDSQYICYDFLTLRKTEAVLKMFEDNNEDVSSYEMFSDNIYLINENNKKAKKYLFITSNYIYILRPYDISQKQRISLRTLDKITISNKNCNLIAFHFIEGDDLLIEILRRMELLYFFRDLYRMKRYGKLKFKYSDNFKIKRNNAYSNIIVDQANNFFITPNFDGAQKLGYLSKLTGTFFTKFNEKLVVLTNVGLLYFDDPNKPPRQLIPIVGSDIQKVDEKRYKKKHCFEIKTLNGENYVFATNSTEELESWIYEFKTFKKNYEKKIKNIEKK